MSRVIYKYQLIPEWDQWYGTRAKVMMPKGAKILHVGNQGELAYVWAIVETDNKRIERIFRIVVTGQEFDLPETRYIGTIHTEDGYVLHVFYD